MVFGAERWDDRVVRRVEYGGDELEILAGFKRRDELGGGDSLAPQDTVLIAPADADVLDLVGLDA
jgi:hypothetical protein